MTRWDDTIPSFKWPVAVARPIATSSEKVWQTISTPGYLELCHPFCAKNPVEVWPGEQARDEGHYLSGSVYFEALDLLGWSFGSHTPSKIFTSVNKEHV